MRGGRLLQLGPGRELVRSPVDPYVAELVRGPLRQARPRHLFAQRVHERLRLAHGVTRERGGVGLPNRQRRGQQNQNEAKYLTAHPGR